MAELNVQITIMLLALDIKIRGLILMSRAAKTFSRRHVFCLRTEEVQSDIHELLVVCHSVPCLNVRSQYGETDVHVDDHAVKHVYDTLTKCTRTQLH